MNIQRPRHDRSTLSKPNNFIEATIALANCYKNALAGGVAGDDDATRFWVDASRSVKSFFKRYQEEGKKENLIANLEKTNAKQILIDSLKVLRQAEPFISSWASKFGSLEVRDFSKFQSFHWDIFIDWVVPLTWDWESDLFIIQHDEVKIVDTLIQRGQKRIVIIEPNKSKRKKLIKYIATKKNKGSFSVVASKEEIKRLVSIWIDNPPHVSRVICSSAIVPSPDEKSDIEEIQSIAREGMMNAITFDFTIKSHDQVWVKNGLGNFENLVKHPHVSCLNDKFVNSSAIIVSPGPSLEKNAHLLKEAKGKATIIAVSHSLEFLKSKGIIPDVILHVDPNVNIKGYFEGFPFEKVDLLVVSATTAPDIFNLPTKNKAWLYANAFYDSWLMELINKEDYTLWGSCVSVAALKLAYSWGCGNVALVGQDLAFNSGNFYAGGSYAPVGVLATFKESLKKGQFKLPGYYGGEVLTKQDYKLYHGQFQELAKDLQKRSSIKLFNCTEGGADIKGYENCTLEGFLSNVVGSNILSNSRTFHSKLKTFLLNNTDKSKVRNNIRKTKRHLTEAQKILEAASSKTEIEHIESYDSVAVNELQRKVAKKLKGSMFLKIALQDALYDVSKDDGFEHSQEGYLKQLTEMYKACLKVIKLLKSELENLNLR